MRDRFDLYGALWMLCSRWHSGQWSRGYRILSRLTLAGYNPGLSIQSGRFESDEQRAMYKVDQGFLPIYSVNTEDEARQLLVATCQTNCTGEFIAPELVADQTLDNLYSFGDRLHKHYQIMRKRRKPA